MKPCYANDLAAGRKLHDQLLEINKAVFYDTNPIPIKYMMKKLGLLANERAPSADGAGATRARGEARRRARASGLSGAASTRARIQAASRGGCPARRGGLRAAAPPHRGTLIRDALACAS